MATSDSGVRKAVTRGGAVVVLASASLMGFLHQWEDGGKTVNTVYADKLAGGIPTACNGITKHVSPVPVVLGDYWSDEKCAEIAAKVTAGTQLKLADCITGPITQDAFDAFSSHAHNFGVGMTCASRAMGLVNAGRLADGCRSLSMTEDGKPNWSSIRQPDGSYKFIQGLNNRRRAETDLCLKGLP